MNFDPLEIGAKFFVYFIPFLFALSFHEFAHGMVALWKGDRTAKMAGRLTLNPLAHADLMGTFILPMIAIVTGFPFFGWANPVPVNERNLKHPVEDMFWIALAGPLSNLLLAFLGAFALILFNRLPLDAANARAAFEFLRAFLYVNLFLAFFNLLPVHPLDGGKVIARFLPYSANRWLEDNQTMLNWGLIIFFFVGGFSFLAGPVDFIAQQMVSIAHFLT